MKSASTAGKKTGNIFALTPTQEGMLFHYLKNPSTDAYFEQLTLELKGDMDRGYFEKAWGYVADANEMLRTCFRWEKLQNPVQLVLKEHAPNIEYHDLFTTPGRAEKDARWEKIKQDDRRAGFDLRRVPFRVKLAKLAENRFGIIISYHHILLDGWSTGIIIKEFLTAYRQLAAGKVLNTRLKKPSFGEFIKYLQGRDRAAQKIFWQDYLSGYQAPAYMPFKKNKTGGTPVKTPAGRTRLILPDEFKQGLDRLSREYGITPAAFFYGVWGILIQRCGDSGDIVFGAVFSGRSAPIKGIEGMVGLFINTLPVRVKSEPGTTVLDLLNSLRDILPVLEEYDATPLVDINNYSPTEGAELFDSLAAIENYPIGKELEPENSDISIESHWMWESTHYDMNVAVAPGDAATVDFIYDAEKFSKETVERMVGYFRNITGEMAGNPFKRVQEIDMLSDDEKRQLIHEFNGVGTVYPAEMTLQRLFGSQAGKTPDAVAVTGYSSLLKGAASLSYEELNRAGDIPARELAQKGAGPGTIVGIMLERGPEMIVGILGILKTGAAYLPINPKNPPERTEYMLKDSGAKLLVTTNDKEGEKVRRWEGEIVLLESIIHHSNHLSFHHSSFIIHHSNHLAYIIYTSGSTGKPKGVPITHGNLSPLLHWGYERLGIGVNDRVVQNLSYYFDWSVWEIFIAITSGAALYTVPGDLVADAGRYAAFIRRNRITVLHITPTHWQSLIHTGKSFDSLRHLCIGAEKLTYDLVKRSLDSVKEACRVYNMYGPTEATIMAAVLEIKREDLSYYRELTSVPIGKNLGNNMLLVLGKGLCLCPLGAPGELYIGGAGVARGYLNNPELTREKFKLNRSYRSYKTYILYKTGDLARCLADGTIEFLGRIDRQVKIRGFRIELGEIENRVLEHAGVKAAVVTARQRNTGEHFLCAYVVFQPGKGSDPIHSLREYLAQRLPGYMIPAYFMGVDAIPLDPNGKADLKKLPAPAVTASTLYAAPGTPIEKSLADIWGRVLGIEKQRIGIDDDFFELGGHSLRVTRLTGLIYKELHVQMPFTEVFLKPTVREQGQWLARQGETRYSPILPAEEKEYYPASAAQKRLFVLHRMTGNSIVYNIHGVMAAEGSPDEEKFRAAVRRLSERHAGLRTSFMTRAGEVFQRIHPLVPDPAAAISRPGGSADLFIKQFIRPFDLTRTPLLRVGLVKMEENRYILILDMHHIISDGISVGVLIKDFITFYEGGNPGKLAPRYHDFSEWQKDAHHTDFMKRQGAYWLKRFMGGVPLLQLPLDYARPAVQVYDGAHLHFEWDDGEVNELHDAAREGNTTLFGVLFSIFNILLAKLSGQEDIVVGTPAAGRNHPDLSHIVGMFVNTLALRVAPKGDKKARDFIKEVGACIVKGFENQEYPFDNLVEKVAVHRDAGRHPLFDVMFAMQNMDIPAIRIPGLNLKPYPYDDGIAKFDLVFICEGEKEPGGLAFTVEFRTRLFKPATIARFIDYFKNIRAAIPRDKGISIGEIEIISQKEKEEILFGFNHIEAVFEGEETLPGLFRSQALKSPDNIALWAHSAIMGEDKPILLSYEELDRGSDRLAFTLRGLGVNTGDIVGIMLKKSLEMIAGILGILKTGAAYLPINPKNPPERTEYMLKDSGAKILINKSEIRNPKLETNPNDQNPNDQNKNRHFGIPFVLNFEHLNFEFVSDFEFRISNFNSSNLAYIIYTSGSTGKPKGVPITHGNLSPLLHWGYNYLGLGVRDRGLQNLAFYFDWSVWEIFIHLTSGAGLYILKEELLTDPAACAAFIETHALTSLHATPTQFQYLAKAAKKLNSLRYLFLGAEKLTYDLVVRGLEIAGEGCRIFNMYGPTEATIISAVLEVDRRDYKRFRSLTSVPIGRSVGNLVLLILDSHFNLCPVGIPGELYITGRGVAAGYLNNPELTAERFYRSYRSYKTYILYKTGDLARWLDDGNVEFLGRMDHQVKIRGHRIELGEIENLLLEHKNIKAAVVIDREAGDNERYLCAYYVPAAEGNPAGVGTTTAEELKKFLARRLPDYMAPSYFIPLTDIPLNANGKVDLKALPEPCMDLVSPGKVYVGPRTETEKKLAEIWAEVLHIPKTAKPMGIDDNFFETGGHSLSAALMVSYIHKAFNVDVPLKEIFITPYIRGLAEYIGTLPGGRYAPLEPVEEKAFYALSPGQRRLFLLQQIDKGTTAYNIPSAWVLEGEPDPVRIEKAFRGLMARHESLRTSFKWVGDEPVQVIHPGVPFTLEHYPIPAGPLPGNWPRPFDLSQAPLMRAGLCETRENRFLLLLDLHHIVSDGMSMDVFTRDFMDLYAGKELPSPQFRYRDYSEWQRSEKERLRLSTQCRYWLGEYRGTIPVLELPLDFPRPAEQRFEGDRVAHEIDGETWGDLKALAAETGATPYMVLLTVYTIFLAKITGQEDIVVGTPAAARSHPNLNNIIGMFVNTLALRNFPAGEKHFRLYLEEVKGRSLNAFENQESPFEELVEKLSAARNINRNPLFDTMLILQNTGPREISIPGLKIVPWEFENKTAKFDLTLTAVERENKLAITWEYGAALFTVDTVKRFTGYFMNLVSDIVKNKEKKLHDLEIASGEDKERILSQFNNSAASYPQDKTIHGLFEEQASRTPDRIAVFGRGRTLTYRQLNEQSDGLAGLLIGKGIAPGHIAAIMTERSLEMVIGIFGILKAGGAYLPIEPSYPQERIDYILTDSGAKIMIGRIEFLESFSFSASPLPRFLASDSSNPSYIIYTSGSTGKPKGVVINHGSVVNLLFAMQENYPFTPPDTYLLKTSYTFDVSVTELFGWYMGGGKLAVLEKGGEKDPGIILEWIERYNVTHINFAPSMFNAFVSRLDNKNIARLSGLKYIFLAGEALLAELVNKFRGLDTNTRLENIYGPTESSVYAAKYSLADWRGKGNIPIGRPMPNIGLYIFDKYNRLQPPGIAGELTIGGMGLARGYLNRPELTAERFYRSYRSYRTYILYKTGDLARWLDDGNIEFLGRIDQQVKIRGFRVELGEIENRLMMYSPVKDAVVIAARKEDRPGEKFLCAYVVMAPGAVLNVSGTREYLSGYLPDYMVPSYIVPLPSLPLNPSGKVDLRALPPVNGGRPRLAKEYIAPMGRLEQEIAGIWAQLLKLDKVGVEDNFFDLGGVSLDIVRVGNRLQEILKKDIPTLALFKYPTVRALARYLGSGETAAAIQKEANMKQIEKLDMAKARKKEIATRLVKRHMGVR